MEVYNVSANHGYVKLYIYVCMLWLVFGTKKHLVRLTKVHVSACNTHFVLHTWL